MRYLLITGFYPDEKQDDSLQFDLDIHGSELNERVAQLIEGKALKDLEPGELLLTDEQVSDLAKLLGVSFPEGLEFYMGTCAG
ncbi:MULTISPECIES: pyocin S6 family toxin immunity protein [unclassified Pseudomonas]|uniref:pyocin S6 family toxin immunity protein n=1 Tax=Pseudomonas sp. Ant30-3 TaxID=1488328 RepID=UPI00048AD7CF|nr:pyocin S6 family toxin immunity protein [Pseudomonas sp. Ant30-3]